MKPYSNIPWGFLWEFLWGSPQGKNLSHSHSHPMGMGIPMGIPIPTATLVITLLMSHNCGYLLRLTGDHTVNSRYNQVRYNEITAYNEMEIFPQSTKCINYYPLITNIGYNEGVYRSQALRYNRVPCSL